MDPQLRQLQSADWLADLGEFPASVVSDACAEWRHKPGGRRPTPGDIRTICVEIHGRREYLKRPALPPPASAVDPQFHERRYQEAAESREAWAKSHGIESFKRAMEIGLVAVSKMPLVNGSETA